MFFFSFQAFANQCRDIFSFPSRDVEAFPINRINAGQNSVGFEYAYYKALRDANLNVETKWEALSDKDKAKISESVAGELSSGVPVIIDPKGRVFAVDQHHDMYALLSLLGKNANPLVPLRVLRDFSIEKIDVIEFKSIVRRNGWIYEKNVDEVVDTPIAIRDLKNSVERSVVGMAFIEISRKENIKLKGKFFSPFVQFLIADFIKGQNLTTFNSSYDVKDVDSIVSLIERNGPLRAFMRSHLVEGAPKELVKFLED